MIKLKIALSGLALACSSPPALAQVTLDVSKITCDQWVAYKVANPHYIALWLSGYYSGTKGNTVLDTQQLDENANKLREFCYVHKQTPVMDAAEAVFGVKR